MLTGYDLPVEIFIPHYLIWRIEITLTVNDLSVEIFIQGYLIWQKWPLFGELNDLCKPSGNIFSSHLYYCLSGILLNALPLSFQSI
jgi:hypothetical protein